MSKTKFMDMINYGKTYRAASAVADAAVAAGDTHEQVADELAFLLCATCHAGNIPIAKAKDIIDRVAKAAPAARMITDTKAAEA